METTQQKQQTKVSTLLQTVLSHILRSIPIPLFRYSLFLPQVH